jgi:hypothetical protein
MKISKKKRSELYAAIRTVIVDTRIKLKLSANDDMTLAQAETKIWDKVKHVLGVI